MCQYIGDPPTSGTERQVPMLKDNSLIYDTIWTYNAQNIRHATYIESGTDTIMCTSHTPQNHRICTQNPGEIARSPEFPAIP